MGDANGDFLNENNNSIVHQSSSLWAKNSNFHQHSDPNSHSSLIMEPDSTKSMTDYDCQQEEEEEEELSVIRRDTDDLAADAVRLDRSKLSLNLRSKAFPSMPKQQNLGGPKNIPPNQEEQDNSSTFAAMIQSCPSARHFNDIAFADNKQNNNIKQKTHEEIRKMGPSKKNVFVPDHQDYYWYQSRPPICPDYYHYQRSNGDDEDDRNNSRRTSSVTTEYSSIHQLLPDYLYDQFDNISIMSSSTAASSSIPIPPNPQSLLMTGSLIVESTTSMNECSSGSSSATQPNNPAEFNNKKHHQRFPSGRRIFNNFSRRKKVLSTSTSGAATGNLNKLSNGNGNNNGRMRGSSASIASLVAGMDARKKLQNRHDQRGKGPNKQRVTSPLPCLEEYWTGGSILNSGPTKAAATTNNSAI